MRTAILPLLLAALAAFFTVPATAADVPAGAPEKPALVSIVYSANDYAEFKPCPT